MTRSWPVRLRAKDESALLKSEILIVSIGGSPAVFEQALKWSAENKARQFTPEWAPTRSDRDNQLLRLKLRVADRQRSVVIAMRSVTRPAELAAEITSLVKDLGCQYVVSVGQGHPTATALGVGTLGSIVLASAITDVGTVPPSSFRFEGCQQDYLLFKDSDKLLSDDAIAFALDNTLSCGTAAVEAQKAAPEFDFPWVTSEFQGIMEAIQPPAASNHRPRPNVAFFMSAPAHLHPHSDLPDRGREQARQLESDLAHRLSYTIVSFVIRAIERGRA